MKKRKKLAAREKLVRYIKARDIFYTYTDFSEHTVEELRALKAQLVKAQRKHSKKR